MKDLQAIISLLNFLGLGGLGAFLYFLFRGLEQRVKALTELANEQKKTLEAVRDRASEADKLSQTYKKALNDFEEMGQKLHERRNDLVSELEKTNKQKDVELSTLRELEIKEIELKTQSLNKLPDLERKLEDAVDALGKQLEILSPDVFSILKSRMRWLEADSFNIENKISNDDVIIFGKKGSGKTAFINYLFSNNIRNEMKFMNKIIHTEFDAKDMIEREKELSKDKGRDDSGSNESDDKDE